MIVLPRFPHRFGLLLVALFSSPAALRAVTVDDMLAFTYTNAPGQVLPYRLWVPKIIEPGLRYPLVVFLHGAGERGTDNRNQLVNADPLVFVAPANQANWPCFFLAPQCPASLTWAGLNQGDRFNDPDGTGDFTTNSPWPMAATMAVLAQLTNGGPYAASLDVSRFYITGLSMGGYGSWEAVCRWPGVFKTAVPICGGGDPLRVATAGQPAVWLFHAADDPTVPVLRSRQMSEAARSQAILARFTEYPATLGIGHASWRPAYADAGLLPWVFGETHTFGGEGVYAEYFSNTNFLSNPPVRRIERGFDLDWETGSPGTPVPADAFSSRLSAQLLVPADGAYTFQLAADDRATFYLDANLVIPAQAMMTNGVSTNVNLTAGRHDLRVEHVEQTGKAWLRLWFGPVGQPRPIVQDMLFPQTARVLPPEFDVAPGVYPSNVVVTLSSPTLNAVIRYTRDGTLPTPTSAIFTNPLVLSAPTTLRAQGFQSNAVASVGVSADYLISPYVVTSLTDRAVAVGATLSWTLAARGIGTLRYQWRFEGQDIVGATHSTFTITNATLSHGGRYEVRITDDVGSRLTAPVTLIVAERPAIIEQPHDAVALAGETAVFTITASGSTPMTFRWRRGGTLLTNLILDSTTSVFSIPNVTLAHAGNYTVGITNYGGAAPLSSNAVLTVLNDFDHDGMADVWEAQFGFNTNNAADALQDADGDGASNRDEYRSGTDPTQADSVLRLAIERTSPASPEVVFQFTAVSNRLYTLFESGGLTGENWQPLRDFAAGTNGLVRFSYPMVTQSNRFYRLGVALGWGSNP